MRTCFCNKRNRHTNLKLVTCYKRGILAWTNRSNHQQAFKQTFFSFLLVCENLSKSNIIRQCQSQKLVKYYQAIVCFLNRMHPKQICILSRMQP